MPISESPRNSATSTSQARRHWLQEWWHLPLHALLPCIVVCVLFGEAGWGLPILLLAFPLFQIGSIPPGIIVLLFATSCVLCLIALYKALLHRGCWIIWAHVFFAIFWLLPVLTIKFGHPPSV